MKKKYFLRGLGAGMILSAIVMAKASSKEELTDAEIKEKALQLGMVEQKDNLKDVLSYTIKPEATTMSAIIEDEETEETIEPEPTKAQILSKEEEKAKKTLEPVATKDVVQRETTKPKPIRTSEIKETRKPVSKPVTKEKIPVTIETGMWSDEIAKKFKEKGLVDDAKKFDDYLCDNGYASLIRDGEYKIPKGATYEEIAKIITK